GQAAIVQFLTGELLLQIFPVRLQVWRLLAPQRYHACQILFVTGGEVGLDYGTQGRFFRLRGGRALRAGSAGQEVEDEKKENEYYGPESRGAPKSRDSSGDRRVSGRTTLNTLQVTPPLPRAGTSSGRNTDGRKHEEDEILR